MTAEEALKEMRKALDAINAPGVHLPPWRAEMLPAPDGVRGNSIGILGGCSIEHDHEDAKGDDAYDACVLTEFATVWNNDARLPASHAANYRERATASAMVAAFNFMSRYGGHVADILARKEPW